MRLEHGDRIFLYTDGLNEAQNASNEFYGMDRAEASVAAHAGKKLSDMEHGVRADMDAFVGGAPQFDDVTLLVFEYK